MNTLLNPFEPGPAATLALFATRMSGLVMVAPAYSARTVPAMVKAGLIVLVTAALAPALLANGAMPVVAPAPLLAELLIGIGLGLGVAVLVGAAEVAGDVISLQTGLAGAASLDPLTQQQSQVLSDFLRLLVITLWLGVGGHLMMLEALAESVALLPPGVAVAGRDGAVTLIAMGSTLFALGLQIAAPVIAAVFVANLAMGVLARIAPQLQIFMLAYPLQIVIGVLVLALILPLLGVTVAGWPEQYRSMVSNLISVLAR